MVVWFKVLSRTVILCFPKEEPLFRKLNHVSIIITKVNKIFLV